MNNLRKVQTNKKSKLNGFVLYAIEFAGRIVHSDYDDDDDVYVTARDIERAKPAWEKLPSKTRDRYKDRASRLNVNVSSTKTKFNSLGQSVSEQEYQAMRLEEEKNRRRKEIETMIQDADDIGELDTKVFYFVSASYFYESINNIYPAEIALVKYSLKEGIFDQISIDINPGELEVGAGYQAKLLSDETHKYPLPPEALGETNYLNILMKIIDFMPQDEEFPILFTEGCDENTADARVLNSTKRILEHIFEKAQEYQIASELRVYSIMELFYYLKEVITEAKNYNDPSLREKSFRDISEAIQIFKQTETSFKYAALACDYHESVDVIVHCCFSKCFRYGYILSKWCCQPEKYDLKPGSHFPKSHVGIYY